MKTKHLLFLMPSLLLSQSAFAINAPEASEVARRQAVLKGSLEKFVQLPTSKIFKQAKQKTRKLSDKLRRLTDESQQQGGAPVTDADISACLVSTCGPAKLNFSAWNLLDTRKNESDTFAKLWESDFAPLIEADMREELAFNTNLVNQLPVAMAAAKFSDQQTLLLKAFVTYKSAVASVTLMGTTLMDFDPKIFKIEVNEDRTKLLTDKMPASKGKLFSMILHRVVRPSMLAKVLVNFKSPLSARLQVYYPGIDDRSALVHDAQKMLNQYQDLERQYGVAASAYLVGMSDAEKSILTSASTGIVLSGGEADAYATVAANIDFYHLPLEDDNLAGFAAMDSGDYDKVVARARGNFVANLAGMTKVFDIDTAVDSTLEICRSKLSVQTAADASYFMRDRALKMITEIRAAAKAVLPNFVAKQNIAAVSAQIDKTDYIFPQKNEITLEKFRMRVLQHRNFISSQAAMLKRGGAEEQNFLVVTSVIRAQMQLEEGTKVIQDASQTNCENISTSTFTDFSVPPFGQISVSWATINYPEYSVGVMAHELGHVVSSKIRNLSLTQTDEASAAFRKSLNCVANRNPFVQQEANLSKFQNTQWSEEDWADHFSVYVTQEMRTRKSAWLGTSKNFACAMLMGNEADYMMNGIQPTGGDPHSAPLLRLFIIDADRGMLTPACKVLMQPTVCQ